jgi:hypothetical protein
MSRQHRLAFESHAQLCRPHRVPKALRAFVSSSQFTLLKVPSRYAAVRSGKLYTRSEFLSATARFTAVSRSCILLVTFYGNDAQQTCTVMRVCMWIWHYEPPRSPVASEPLRSCHLCRVPVPLPRPVSRHKYMRKKDVECCCVQ